MKERERESDSERLREAGIIVRVSKLKLGLQM